MKDAPFSGINVIFKSVAALQTTEATDPGSNTAPITVNNSEDRQSHCVYCKISGQRGKLPPAAKKRKEQLFKYFLDRANSALKYSFLGLIMIAGGFLSIMAFLFIGPLSKR